MPTIELYRELNLWDRARAYKVILDGELVGTIRRGKTVALDVASGPHQIYLKMDWLRSKRLEFEVRDNETAFIRCSSPGSNPFTLIYKSTLGWSRYIGLEASLPWRVRPCFTPPDAPTQVRP